MVVYKVRFINLTIASDNEAMCGLEGNGMITEFQNIDIVEAMYMSGYTRILELIKRAGLEDALKSAKGITLFAPNDKAFDKMDRDEYEALLSPQNRDKLISMIKYHILSSAMTSSAVEMLDDIETLSGEKIEIFKRNGSLLVNDAEIIEKDIKTENGIIHVIDSVLTKS